MAKRPETRAAAAKKSPARKPATRPAAKAAKKAKITAAESERGKAKSATAKSAKATAPIAKAKAKPARKSSDKQGAPAKAPAKAVAKKAAVKAKPAPARSASAKPAPARKTKGSKAKAKASSKPNMPRFLAAELGHPVDHDGEPIGAGSRAALGDTELQRYTLQLWRQMQSRRGVNTHIPAMERAGVTIDQIWTAGVTDRLTTSSTPDEVKRYRQKLLFRANLLESILTETVDELQRLGTIDPTPSPAASEPG